MTRSVSVLLHDVPLVARLPRLDPLDREQRLAGGCRFTRPIVDLLTTAGFTIAELDVFYEKGAPKFAGADSLGTALSP